jgi:outer membrane protein TolC
MKRSRELRNVAFVATAILAAVWFVLPARTSHADDQPDPKARIKKLQEERLAAAKEIYDLDMKAYQRGGVSYDRARQALVTLLHARLDLAETKDERIKVMEEIVKSAKQWEESVGAMAKSGVIAGTEALRARVDRLSAEIALEKARAEK